MSAQSLFRGDSITINGQAIAVMDGSIMIKGLAGYTSKSVPSASGPDFSQHERIPREITFKVLFGPKSQAEDFTKLDDARVVVKDSKGPRRVLATRVSFGSMGDLGSGPVDVSLNVGDPYQLI
jgi:hypothetical protein